MEHGVGIKLHKRIIELLMIYQSMPIACVQSIQFNILLDD